MLSQVPAEQRRINRIRAKRAVPPNFISVWFKEFRVINSARAWTLWHRVTAAIFFIIYFQQNIIPPQTIAVFSHPASGHNELVVWLWDAWLHSSSLCTSSPFLVKTTFTPAAREVSAAFWNCSCAWRDAEAVTRHRSFIRRQTEINEICL